MMSCRPPSRNADERLSWPLHRSVRPHLSPWSDTLRLSGNQDGPPPDRSARDARSLPEKAPVIVRVIDHETGTERMTTAGAEKSRAVGALLGLAIGDAVGATVEFRPRGSFLPVTGLQGGGAFRLRPGQWTDDTAMALCLAESLLTDASCDPRDLMDRFARWVEDGHNSSTGRCFGIGRVTLGAIGRYRRTGEPLSGDTGAKTASNGSVMRLAPVAIRWSHDACHAEAVARLQSRTTHGAAEAVDGCALLARILVTTIRTGDREAALAPLSDETWSPAIRAIAQGGWRGKPSSAIESTGYVVHTLEAALWAVDTTASFRDAVLAAANLGHDADTVAAVTGQIAGAVYGMSGIPAPWIAQLHARDRIVALASALHDARVS